MVSLIADAIVEAKGGVLENAYQEDEAEGDITMEDVIINVEQQAAEYERKRRQKYEERRQQMQQRRYNGERRVFRRDNNNARPAKAEEAPKAEAAAEAKTEEVKA